MSEGKYVTLDAMLAAAEERGRRSGVEEAARFCDQRLGENFGDRIRALAPRDSAPAEENRDVFDVEREP